MPQRLAEQCERIAVAEAMSAASDLADLGKLAKGRALLQAAVDHAKASPIARSPFLMSIVTDAEAVDEGYTDQVTYRSLGRKMSVERVMSHQMQRSTHTSGKAYERKAKVAMKSMFSGGPSSAPSSAVDLDGERNKMPRL
jgi:hypothetical protein